MYEHLRAEESSVRFMVALPLFGSEYLFSPSHGFIPQSGGADSSQSDHSTGCVSR